MHFNQHLAKGNTTSLTGIIDVVAHSISLIKNEEQEPENLLDIFIHQDNIATVQDVSIPLGGGLFFTQKEFIGDINNDRVPGLEALLDYLNANYYDRNDPAINNNYYTIHKHLYNNDYTQYVTNKIDNRKTFKNYNHVFKEDNFLNLTKHITNHTTNNITKQIFNDEYNLILKKDYSTRHTNVKNTYNHLMQNDNILIKKHDNRIFNTTTNIHKPITNIDNSVFNYTQIKKQIDVTNKNINTNSTYTDYFYQRNVTKNDKRRTFIIQQNNFLFQRNNTDEVEIAILQAQITDLQNQINDLQAVVSQYHP